MSLEPLQGQEITCYQGFTWSQEFDFYADAAR